MIAVVQLYRAGLVDRAVRERRRSAAAPFTHGAVHAAGGVKLYDSYHCSRYNTNTRVLTPEMFRSVFERVKADLKK